ncbi:MAG: hypothetical protein RMJ45_03250 [Candidatus Calescibacterium sp.]|nr:hypothetical protein [Candidatus Calescibacterium sp.]
MQRVSLYDDEPYRITLKKIVGKDGIYYCDQRKVGRALKEYFRESIEETIYNIINGEKYFSFSFNKDYSHNNLILKARHGISVFKLDLLKAADFSWDINELFDKFQSAVNFFEKKLVYRKGTLGLRFYIPEKIDMVEFNYDIYFTLSFASENACLTRSNRSWYVRFVNLCITEGVNVDKLVQEIDKVISPEISKLYQAVELFLESFKAS